MPWYWTMAEGPPIVLFGIVILALVGAVEGAPGPRSHPSAAVR
jgi:hypothetical protein